MNHIIAVCVINIKISVLYLVIKYNNKYLCA